MDKYSNFKQQKTKKTRSRRESIKMIMTCLQAVGVCFILMRIYFLNPIIPIIGLVVFDTCEIFKMIIRYMEYKDGEIETSPLKILVVGMLSCFVATIFTLFMMVVFNASLTA